MSVSPSECPVREGLSFIHNPDGTRYLFLRCRFFCPYNQPDEETEAEKNQVLCQGHPAGRWRNRAQNSDDLNYGFYKGPSLC